MAFLQRLLLRIWLLEFLIGLSAASALRVDWEQMFMCEAVALLRLEKDWFWLPVEPSWFPLFRIPLLSLLLLLLIWWGSVPEWLRELPSWID